MADLGPPDVHVELGRELSSQLPAFEGSRAALTRDVDALLEHAGLTGPARVSFSSGDAAKPFRVMVGGRMVPCRPATVAETWAVVSGPDHAQLAWGGEDSLPELIEHQPELAPAYLRSLVLATLGASPALLVDPWQAARCLERTRASIPLVLMQSVMAWLVGMGVALRDPAALVESIDLSRGVGRSTVDVAEGAYRRLRREQVEIVAHPRYLAALTGGEELDAPAAASDERLPAGQRDELQALDRAVRERLGVPLPPVTWVPSADLAEGLVGIRVNDSLVVRRGLDIGTCLADERPERLEHRGFAGRFRPHPMNPGRWCAVADATAETVRQAGMGAWDELGFALLLLFGELDGSAGRLVSIDSVERWLAAVEPECPDLVQSVTARFSLGCVTRVLRRLVVEGAGIGDLRGILERLALFDTVLVSDAGLVLDDRLPVIAGKTLAPATADDWPGAVAFVRLGMRDAIVQRCAQGRDLVIAHDVGAAQEAAAHGTSADLVASVAASLRQAARRFVPVVLTSAAGRTAVHDVLAAELARLPVVAEPELGPGVRLIRMNAEGGAMKTNAALTEDRVRNLLEEFVGLELETDEDGDLHFVYRTVHVFVRVLSWGDDSTLVSVFCPTNHAVPASPDLFRWVATLEETAFGHLGAAENDDGVSLVYQHRLLGDFLDQAELYEAVQAVAFAADELAGQVKERFGGRLFGEPAD